ncbi:phosphoglucosamine mutase [Thermodesulforhabdus norvegica]|uniref:Phosphoglucosamine mutase n=1 Tax=Thermodesulforhabdus norvegica TaxID=39841 RepID=A0A1I4U5M1_9BACT|nr:phosphoglucosamine mutase [Thermodesulforhabdus norvegica]SFM83973.1 phosphoglucosamine mutase [Thermodesulforhabdus norvegica]
MGRLFGTDGIRGVANEYPMTAEIALKVGAAVASYFRNSHGRPRILIGKDTRLSGYMLEYAMVAGICSMGADVLLAGPLPTPGIAFITRDMRADAGVVISASHNPYEYNGIKIFAGDGFKLPDHIEEELERRVTNFETLSLPPYEMIGRARRIEDVQGRYIVHLKNTFPPDADLEGITLVVDCAHGATYKVAPLIFEELGARVITIGTSPDGRNINRDCGALHPQAMAEAVKLHDAHAGIAFDGDGDRVIFSDEKGNILDGDVLMAICARDMLNRDALAQRTVVATVMSNLGLEIALRRMNARLIRTAVGDRYVVEEMRRGGYVLGGEQSGHIVFLNHSTTGDGILSALQVLAVMTREGRPLSELASVMERIPQKLTNVPVNGTIRSLSLIPDYEVTLKKVEAFLGDDGRVLVRPSGTEPVIRIMVEATREELIDKATEMIIDFLKRHLDIK